MGSRLQPDGQGVGLRDRERRFDDLRRQRSNPAAAGDDPGGAETGDEVSGPTGQVFNDDSNAFEGDAFIFVTEAGTIAGWAPDDGEMATLRVDNSGKDAVYKGVAIATDNAGTTLLYAADFRNGAIGVYDDAYQPADTTGDFTDPDLPDGYAPFNVEAAEGVLLVTYALQDEEGEDDVPGPGNGYVDMFDLQGNLMSRLVSRAELNAPWGIVLTPDAFSAAPNRLLIGNFGDGRILSYALDPNDASAPPTFEGALRDENGDDIVIDGLWALEFGPDTGNFRSDQLYFTAGPNDEENGIFGSLASSTTRRRRRHRAASAAPSAPSAAPSGLLRTRQEEASTAKPPKTPNYKTRIFQFGVFGGLAVHFFFEFRERFSP